MVSMEIIPLAYSHTIFIPLRVCTFPACSTIQRPSLFIGEVTVVVEQSQLRYLY